MTAAGLDAILIGFQETPLPPALAALPPDDPLGFFYRTAFLRVGGAHLEPHIALSQWNNEATGRDGLYHWSEIAPLALHQLTAKLRGLGFRAEMIRFVDGEHERLAHLLETADPRSVCISTTFYVDPLPVLDLVAFVREHNRRTKIILGGPFVQDLCRDHHGGSRDRLLEALGADLVIYCRDGQHTLARLMPILRDGADPRQVPNLAVLEQGVVQGWTPAEPEPAKLGPIAWSLLSDDELGHEVNVRTSLGCAYRCAFCEFPVRAGRHLLGNLDVVAAEIRHLGTRGVRHLCLVDDAINVPPHRLEQLALALRRTEMSWSAHYRAAEPPQPGLFELLRESGCVALHLGIESGDAEMLARMNKTGRTTHNRSTIELCHQHGILSHAALVIGFPGETAQSLERTIDFVNETEPTTFKPQPFFYHHHAPIHRRARAVGLEGRGWRWHHQTMSSREAFAAAALVRQRVKRSRFVGDRQMFLFMLPWLLCKGMHKQELLEALTLFDLIQRDSFDARSLGRASRRRREQRIVALRNLCHNLQLEPSRFTMSSVARYAERRLPIDRRQVFVELGALGPVSDRASTIRG